jgi:hypothetical protein
LLLNQTENVSRSGERSTSSDFLLRRGRTFAAGKYGAVAGYCCHMPLGATGFTAQQLEVDRAA